MEFILMFCLRFMWIKYWILILWWWDRTVGVKYMGKWMIEFHCLLFCDNIIILIVLAAVANIHKWRITWRIIIGNENKHTYKRFAYHINYYISTKFSRRIHIHTHTYTHPNNHSFTPVLNWPRGIENYLARNKQWTNCAVSDTVSLLHEIVRALKDDH